jgi:AcrR family transcriptional regulator
MDAMAGKRALNRTKREAEILAAAEAMLVERGPHDLNLRDVARRVDLSPSALYRYVDGLDGIYTRLIINCYDEQSAAAAAAVDENDPPDVTIVRIARAVRRWATENPQKFALVYGTPVPGYQAPQHTVPAAAGVATLVLEQIRKHRPGLSPDPTDSYVPDSILELFALVYGILLLEAGGHFVGVIDDVDSFFEQRITDAVSRMLADLC